MEIFRNRLSREQRKIFEAEYNESMKVLERLKSKKGTMSDLGQVLLYLREFETLLKQSYA